MHVHTYETYRFALGRVAFAIVGEERLGRVLHASSVENGVEAEDLLDDVGSVLQLVELGRFAPKHFKGFIDALREDRVVLGTQLTYNLGMNGQASDMLDQCCANGSLDVI